MAAIEVGMLDKKDSSGDVEYNYQVQVTRYIANIGLQKSCNNPNEWIVDSASNAFLAPFLDCIQNYSESDLQGEVKGIRGKFVAAQGIGSATLTNSSGNQYTLGDALFVPQAANLVAPQTQASRFGL
jgi:hypothetical protein